MNPPRTTLEQWRTLQSIIDCGGFAQAAEHLHRSQSAVSYAVSRLQEHLGSELLTLRGRKAELTETGAILLARARELLHEAGELEQLAAQLRSGWESEIELVFDAVFPSALLLETLTRFSRERTPTRVQLREVVLSGAEDALRDGHSDLVISPIVPAGFIGERLIEVEFIAVAHPDHPLHQRDTLNYRDLKHHTQLVIRDSGLRQQRDAGWLGAKHRWTVSSMSTSISALTRRLGFGWLPRHAISAELASGLLKPLPLTRGQRRHALLYLILPHGDDCGPATRRLADMLCEAAHDPHFAPRPE